MPLTHKEIEQLLSDASGSAAQLIEYRQATVPLQVNLSAEMAAALGLPARRLTPFLATVVDVIANKLEVDDEALKLGKVADTKAVRGWLGDNDWSLIERELYHAVVRDGRAFVLTGWGETGPKLSVVAAYNGICGAHVECEDGEPVSAWNTWHEADGVYLDIYYPDRIEKYLKPKGDKKEWVERTDVSDEAWPIPWVDDAGQPLGIALTAFQIDNSDIADAIQIARDMNETLLDMLASSRTQGWPQRWIKGQKNADVLLNGLGQPIISSATGRPIQRVVQASPGSIIRLSDGAELGQLAAVTPDPTLLDKLLELLSFLTTVPTHYFSGQWPSGVALIQAESRLNHKVEGHQGRLTSAIVAVLRLSMRLSNYFAGTAFNTEQPILIPWKPPQIETEDLVRDRQRHQQDTIVKLVGARLMSLETAIRELHPDWTDEQVADELVRLGPQAAQNTPPTMPQNTPPTQEPPA